MSNQKIGTIIKVSGPLVVAKGLEGAKMYEVVKVSEKKLIGEIIELKGDQASIQVYEETSGLGPGEPVYRTGSPLTVELGPGLISSIYDGIQRPLDLIIKKAGAYITRGIEIPGLDQNKKWNFVPLKKKGDKVEAGDIIGEVEETTLVKHKIMVPPDIEEGLLKEIKRGAFTVEETVAKIQLKAPSLKLRALNMKQIWPVRTPRPYKEKLIPQEPLITGQRVIDAFFPVTKGGTACIPGPFGSGKCVTGDTPVILGNGKILSIKEIFGEGKKKGKQILGEKYEEIYNISNLSNPTLISLKDKKFKVKEPVTVYKGKTDSTIKIKTRTGKSVELTPVHKLYILEDGKIVQRQAREIKEGDYLVTPRKISLDIENQPIKILEIIKNKKLFSGDEEYNKVARKYIKILRAKQNGNKRLDKFAYYKRPLPFWLLLNLHRKTKFKDHPYKIASYHGKIITLPQKVSPDFAEFLGYVVADGNLKESSFSIRFYNAEKEIIDRFSKLSKKLFNIEPYIYKHPKGNLSRTFPEYPAACCGDEGVSEKSFQRGLIPRWKVRDLSIAQIDCKALFDLLVGLGIPTRQKAKNARVPEIILKSSDQVIAAFISAYIACDGSVDIKGSRLEINSASRQIIKELSFALIRIGVVSSIEKTKKDGTTRLWIKSSDQLEQLSKHVNITGKKKGLLAQAIKPRRWSTIDALPLPTLLKELLKTKGIFEKLAKELKIYATRYVYQNQKIGRTMFNKLINNGLSKIMEVPKEIKQFLKIWNEVFFDQIIKIERASTVKEVYDLEVPGTHNFVGGHGPLLLHNTVVQHQLAKWSDADIIIYCATGERGNEVCDVLTEFPELKDPYSGEPLMKRTIIIANTSNMPVAAREASIYTAVTLGEYFRDMGYKICLVADSTSRWAEALREISGRLEEMPGEEAYPAYLGARTAAFYERAGEVLSLGSPSRKGSLSVIGAVSPPGGDFSEPVTQNTLRVTKVFWGLDDTLASKRHFPAINWLTSYSLYTEDVDEYMKRQAGSDWPELRVQAMDLLQQEASLEEIVRLVGAEALSQKEQLILHTAKSLREDFLHQNAFDEIDTYTSLKKQFWMLKVIIIFHEKALAAIERQVKLEELIKLPVKEKIVKAKFVPEDKLSELENLVEEIGKEIENIKQ